MRVLLWLVVTFLQRAPSLATTATGAITCEDTPVDELQLLDKAGLQHQYCIFLARRELLTRFLELNNQTKQRLLAIEREDHGVAREALDHADTEGDEDAKALKGCAQMVTRTARVMASRGLKVPTCPAPTSSAPSN